MEYKHLKLIIVLLLLLLSFNVFVPTNTHPLLCLDKWFVEMYLNARLKMAWFSSRCYVRFQINLKEKKF